MTNTEKLDLLLTEVAEIKGELKRIDDLQKAVNGNGHAGLIERVTRLEQSRKSTMIFFSIINGIVVAVSALITMVFTIQK